MSTTGTAEASSRSLR